MALFAVVGVSAQNWSRTLATGLPGQEVTHDVNGTSVTQYRVETALFEKAATGVRYTVVQTTATGTYGGGPFFAMGEMIVLDAQGDTIQYTATSNADHNSGGAGADGAGLPALNDGNFNNYFHSSWGGTEPGGLHYLELTFAEPVDAFQLIWYTRPNQHVNRPQVVGLTEPGVAFTEDMLFAEYDFSLGEQVTDLATLQVGGAFTLYAEGPAEYNGTEGKGNTYIALNTNTYTVGQYTVAAPQNIVQFIPATDGRVILYQPIMATYYSDPNRWTSNYNGKNGWLMAHGDAQFLDEFTLIERNDGEFEITTEIYRQQKNVDGTWYDEWTNFEEPITVWVGYDMRGNLKIFPKAVKEGLENGDYTQGFGLPVDFGFKINKANVNKEMVPEKTASEMCSELLASTIKLATQKQEEYADIIADYDIDDAADALAAALDNANAAVENGDLAAAYAAKNEISKALALYVAQKNYYYDEISQGLDALLTEDNMATPPYTQADAGKYTQDSKDIVDQINEKVSDIYNNGETYSYSQIEAIYAQIEALIVAFEKSVLEFTEFPAIVSDIPADNFPYSDLPNNAVWKQKVVLAQAASGIRLTFLDRHIGTAADGGNFPMIAIGELKIYDGEGNEVTMAAENFYANHTETNEGFESTVARLCDGNFAVHGYYHSPWFSEPQEYIYIDITFPQEMDNFTFEVYSRDKSTSNGAVSLFPKKVAITAVGEGYDPLLFTENPYNVFVGEKVTDPSQITADGLYVIKGFLNTQTVWKEVTEGEGEEAVTTIEQVEPEGTAMFYKGTDRFHANPAAVRAESVYRFVPNGDGTFKALSLALGKYWPSTDENGYVDNKVTYEASKAANLNIVASTNIEGTFVMYEKIDGLTTDGDSIDTDEDGKYDGVEQVYQTPYVMFMDWADRLATRPVIDPQPVETSAELADNWGDAQCFTKENGEAEWEIYKVTMENPDFYYLSNLTGAFEQLGLVVGTNPGEVSNLGNLEAVLADGQKVIADSAFDKAAAAAAALANEIAIVNSLEKNPMVEGVYQVVSPVAFAETKALYATVTEDGTPTFGWKSLEQDNKQFYFHFTKSANAEDLVAGGGIDEEDGDKVYNIRAIATYDGNTPYYIGEIDAQSTPVDLFADAHSDYLVLNATGSAFNLRLAGLGAGYCIHANGHGGGAGTAGNIVYWDGAAGASQWYLRKVDYDLETSIEDLVTEGTEVVAVSYFTPAGAAVPAPVKGINIVVTVYANGVVETKKVLVK